MITSILKLISATTKVTLAIKEAITPTLKMIMYYVIITIEITATLKVISQPLQE